LEKVQNRRKSKVHQDGFSQSDPIRPHQAHGRRTQPGGDQVQAEKDQEG